MPERLTLDPVEQRVLGALLEKQRTVPDTYPLSLNALRAACNQSTSRDPVVDYDEPTLVDTLGRLRDRELVRFLKPTGLRVVKYHQRLEEQLGLDPEQAALIAVLLLRGPQTAGELRPRTERLAPFADREAVEAALREHGEPLTRRWSANWNDSPGSTTGAGSTCSAPRPPESAAPPAPVDLEQVLVGRRRRPRSLGRRRLRPAGRGVRRRPRATSSTASRSTGGCSRAWPAESGGGQGLDVGLRAGPDRGVPGRSRRRHDRARPVAGHDRGGAYAAPGRLVRPGQFRGAADAPGR